MEQPPGCPLTATLPSNIAQKLALCSITLKVFLKLLIKTLKNPIDFFLYNAQIEPRLFKIKILKVGETH